MGNPAGILRDLDAQWLALGKPENGGVLRACSMTLVVLTDRPDDHQQLGETLAALTRDHPSRAVIVRLNGREGAALEARASVQCWMPFGRRQQICSEQIEVSVAPSELATLSGVLRGLAVPDLPVVVWCSSNLDLDLVAVLELADKVIVNSTGAPHAASQLARVRSLVNGSRAVADLSWTRLSRWRQTIAQVFESPERRAFMAGIEEVSLSHYSSFIPVRALYLAAWLRNAIGDQPQYWFRQAGREMPCQPRGEVEGVSLLGPGIELSILQLEGESVELTLDGVSTHKVFPMLNDYTLLREELSIPGRDPVYDAVLQQASQLAAS